MLSQLNFMISHSVAILLDLRKNIFCVNWLQSDLLSKLLRSFSYLVYYNFSRARQGEGIITFFYVLLSLSLVRKGEREKTGRAC